MTPRSDQDTLDPIQVLAHLKAEPIHTPESRAERAETRQEPAPRAFILPTAWRIDR